MARIQFSNLVSSVAGKLGGTIYQRNRFGTIARTLTIPIQPLSTRRASQQAIQYELAHRWTNLTHDQRTAWATWSTYQNLHVGTFASIEQPGQLAYIQANRYRALTGLPFQDDPVFTPYNRPPLSISKIRRIAGPPNLIIELSRDPDPTLERIILYISATVKPSINSPRKLLFILIPESDYAQDIDILTQYLAAFGRFPSVGEHLFAEIALIQVSNSTLSIFSRNKFQVSY